MGLVGCLHLFGRQAAVTVGVDASEVLGELAPFDLGLAQAAVAVGVSGGESLRLARLVGRFHLVSAELTVAVGVDGGEALSQRGSLDLGGAQGAVSVRVELLHFGFLARAALRSALGGGEEESSGDQESEDGVHGRFVPSNPSCAFEAGGAPCLSSRFR